MALITEFSLILMAIHAGPGQAHGVCLHVAREIGPHSFANDRFFPVRQKISVDDPNHLLRFNALLFVGRGLGCRDIARFSADGIMPDRIGHEGEEDDQAEDDLACIMHDLPPLPS